MFRVLFAFLLIVPLTAVTACGNETEHVHEEYAVDEHNHGGQASSDRFRHTKLHGFRPAEDLERGRSSGTVCGWGLFREASQVLAHRRP